MAEECVEPELLNPGEGPRRAGPRQGGLPPQKPGLLARLTMFAAAALALLAMGLFLSGALLTSTVIGAVLGIPLMLAGALVFFLLFKLLTFGANSAFVFRRF